MEHKIVELSVISLYLFHQINHRGEVVAVTVHKHTAREGTQGVALTVALAAAQELAVQYLGT